MQVVIVGGGIAGLATAYELNRRAVPFVLLESAPRVGGVILSEQVDGYTIDAGPDSLLVQKPDGIKLCEELGLGDRLVATKPPRLAFIQRHGRLHPLPAASVLGIPTRVGPFLRTGLFSWPGKIRMGAELFVPARRDEEDESIGAFIRRRFGREAAEYLAEPLLAGIHAGDVDRLSVRALFPRFVEAERQHGSLLRAFRQRAAAQSDKQRPDGNQSAFRSLPGGLSEMIRALVGALPADAVRCGRSVRTIVKSPPGAQAFADPPRFVVETDHGDRVDASAVVLATPAYITARIVQDIDDELAGLCAAIPYASTATVALAFGRDEVAHPLNGSGFVVPRAEGSPILAASWLSSKWPGRAPDGRVLLRTFFGGARDPRALEKSDEELIALSLRALTPVIGIAAAPSLARVYRWVRANPQHEVGHLAHIANVERALARHPGLFITGSAFRGVGIPDCVADGRLTARQVATCVRTLAVR